MRIYILLLSFFFTSTVFSQYLLKGKVTGYDGKPMKMSHVFIMDRNDTTAWTQTEPSGAFSLPYSVAKTYTLVVMGVHHKRYIGSLYVAPEKTQELDIRLGTFDYAADGGEIMLSGDFNNFSTAENLVKAKWISEKTTVQLPKKDTRYFILNLAARSAISGISDKYVLTGLGMGGDGYASVSTNNDKAVFSLSDFPAPGQKVQAVYSNKVADKMNLIDASIIQRERVYIGKVMQAVSGGKMDRDKFQPIDLSEEYAKLENEIAKETDALNRQFLLLEYLAIEGVKTKFRVGGGSGGGSEKPFSYFKGEPKREYVEMALKEIDPLSPLWTATREVVKAPLNAMPNALDRLMPFYDSILNYSGDNSLRGSVLEAITTAAYKNNQAAIARNYYGRLKSEYPGSSMIQFLKKEYNIIEESGILDIAPSFAYRSIDNSSKMVSTQSLKGKYYLLDFWSVGCGGCIAEMPNLHKVYEQFKDKTNFEMISVALNPTLQITKDFRKRYPMPWTNIQPADMFNSEMAKNYKVVFLPRVYLIDPAGKVIAYDDELKGEQLVNTLKKYVK
jgi:thiol-disulfide isomerase/thioredoxin